MGGARGHEKPKEGGARNHPVADPALLSKSAVQLLGNADEAFLQVGGFGRVQFDHEPPAAFERDTHDQAAPLFSNFHRAVAGAWFHSRHKEYPLH